MKTLEHCRWCLHISDVLNYETLSVKIRNTKFLLIPAKNDRYHAKNNCQRVT